MTRIAVRAATRGFSGYSPRSRVAGNRPQYGDQASARNLWQRPRRGASERVPGAGRGARRRRPAGEAQAVGWTARAARSWRSKAVGGERRLGAPKWNPWA